MTTEDLMLKYRPENFDEFIGHGATVKSIQNNLGRVHKYLFHGPRGCGKTSLARLVAKELGVNEDWGLIEIDGADKRGVAEARELKKSVVYGVIGGGNKVYVIDEVHMLTTEAFNTLLKTLEEPPNHVYFILCTTEIGEVPDTIRSRCKAGEFQLGTLLDREINSLLDWVIDEEKIDICDEVFHA
jgi:DNA polymerase-3 subunit gamma/tau